MKQFIFIIGILIIANTLLAEETVIPSTIYDSIYPRNLTRKDTLILGKSFKGNFTNSGYDEYIAFYYRKDEEKDPPLYRKVLIYVIKGKSIINRYGITEMAFQNYSKFAQKTIKELESYFGQWNGYYYQYDLNKNGIKELILFPYSGNGLFIKLFEFKDDKFVSLTGADGYDISKITVDIQKSAFTVYSGYEYEAHKKGFQSTIFAWNSQKGKYEIVKKEEEVTPKK